jgi:Zn-dependent peptidase ImmA (M78 family)
MAIIRRKLFSTPSDASSSDIAIIDTPEKILSFAKLKQLTDIPLDVEGLAREFGIKIEYVKFADKEELSGILFKDESQSSWIMQINEDHHPNRQRYTIAHELGHFCLHRHFQKRFEDQIFFRGGEASKEEWEANDFASAILIPEDEFRKQIESGLGNVEDLAEKFKVSTLALRIRAKNLSIMGHGL